MAQDFWTPERVARLLELTALQHSAREIANDIGCSRNAVIGKWHRSGIGMKSGAIRPRLGRPMISEERRRERLERKRALRISKIEFRDIPADDGPVLSPNPKQFGDLARRECKFPISPHNTRQHVFCGNETLGLRPYCVGHCLIAYRPDSKPKPFVLPPLWSAA